MPFPILIQGCGPCQNNPGFRSCSLRSDRGLQRGLIVHSCASGTGCTPSQSLTEERRGDNPSNPITQTNTGLLDKMAANPTPSKAGSRLRGIAFIQPVMREKLREMNDIESWWLIKRDNSGWYLYSTEFNLRSKRLVVRLLEESHHRCLVMVQRYTKSSS